MNWKHYGLAALVLAVTLTVNSYATAYRYTGVEVRNLRSALNDHATAIDAIVADLAHLSSDINAAEGDGPALSYEALTAASTLTQ